MKDKEYFLGDIKEELGEVQKLDVNNIPEESKISLGANFITIFCCG